MAYQKNKPAASDKLKNSQSDIQGNFQAINDFLEVNHDISTFTSPASGNEGKHNKVDLVRGSGATAFGTDNVIYNKQNAFNNENDLFFNNASNTYPITAGKRNTTGWAFLSRGIIVWWGSSGGSGDVIIEPSVTPVGVPAAQVIYAAQVTSWTQNGTEPTSLARLKHIDLSGASNGRITVTCTNLSGTAAAASFYYYIIGALKTAM